MSTDAPTAVARRHLRRRGQVVAAALAVVLAIGAIAAIAAVMQQGGNRVRTVDSAPAAIRPSAKPYLGIQSVVGRIIASSSAANFKKSITLDRGTERGVALGMPVVTSDGLVGRVVQVSKDECKVLLLDDPAFTVGVRVNGRASGLAQGQAGRSTLVLTLDGPLATATRPQEHDLAETSGVQGSAFPPGIPVGRVDAVKVSGHGPTISARLVPTVNVRDLEYVQVLLWPNAVSQPASPQTVDAAKSALPGLGVSPAPCSSEVATAAGSPGRGQPGAAAPFRGDADC